jgi:hypothetical protein
MKTKACIVLASAAIGISVFLALTQAGTPGDAGIRPSIQKSSRPSAPAASFTVPIAEAEPEFRKTGGESENLVEWQNRFNNLLQQNHSSDEAVRLLLAEMDATYGNWVASQVEELADLPPGDRYDRLAEIEIAVQEGAAAILDLLEVEGSRHVSVLAGPLETVSAEIQYAESAPDPQSRLALLRLDRERGSRMEQVLAITEEPIKSQAIAELETWYDTGLGGIFASTDPD